MNRAGGLVALVVLVCAAPLVRPAAAAEPGTFDLATTAVGVRVTSTQAPAASIITAGLIDATEAFATSALSSYGASESTAAGLYPGDLVAGGPQLLCDSFGPCPFDPPAYPLVAQASYPTVGTAAAPGASARAGRLSTGAAAQGGGQGSAGVTVESAVASTRAWVDAAGAHVRSRSLVTGITVGPLRIAAVEALESVDVPTTGAVVDRPSITVSGATVAGQAVVVDGTGVHAFGSHAPLAVPELVQQGLDVRLLGASRQDRPGAVRSAAGGLLVAVSVPVTGVPQLVPGIPSLNRRYVGSVLLGGAGAVVSAGVEAGLVLPPPPVPVVGSPAQALTPPYLPVVPIGPLGERIPTGASTGPVMASGPTVETVAFLPLASLRAVALALLVLPLLLFLAWRAQVMRSWRAT